MRAARGGTRGDLSRVWTPGRGGGGFATASQRREMADEAIQRTIEASRFAQGQFKRSAPDYRTSLPDRAGIPGAGPSRSARTRNEYLASATSTPLKGPGYEHGAGQRMDPRSHYYALPNTSNFGGSGVSNFPPGFPRGGSSYSPTFPVLQGGTPIGGGGEGGPSPNPCGPSPVSGWYANTQCGPASTATDPFQLLLLPWFTSLAVTIPVPLEPPAALTQGAYQGKSTRPYLVIWCGLAHSPGGWLFQPELRFGGLGEDYWHLQCEAICDRPSGGQTLCPNMGATTLQQIHPGMNLLCVVAMFLVNGIPQYVLTIVDSDEPPPQTPLSSIYWPPLNQHILGYPSVFMDVVYPLVLEAHGVDLSPIVKCGLASCSYFPGGNQVTSNITVLTQPNVFWTGTPSDENGHISVLPGEPGGAVWAPANNQPPGTAPDCEVTATFSGNTSTISWNEDE